MGCDIHLYLENVETIYNGNLQSRSIGQFHSGRNYTMFSLMANVRNYDGNTLFSPKGLPTPLGYEAKYDNELYVIKDEDYHDQERYVSRTVAEGWVGKGISLWTDPSMKWVTHPDWHSHSWLTFEELQQVKAAYIKIRFPREGWYQREEEIDWRDIDARGISRDNVQVVFHDSGTMKNYYEVNIGPWSVQPFPIEYEAVLAALQSLGEGGRIVFWFDN